MRKNIRTWTQIPEGKYQGRTLPDLSFIDPDFLYWNYQQPTFQGELQQETREVHRKSRHILIPPAQDKVPRVAEYRFDLKTRRFVEMVLVPIDSAPTEDYKTVRKPVIDLATPFETNPGDLTGCTRLVRDVKRVIFGTPGYRMTKQRCEAFYTDDARFVVPQEAEGGEPKT